MLKKRMKRVISVMMSVVMTASAIPVIASAQSDDEWQYVRDLVGKYTGTWSTPPTNVVTGNMTSGPILGNGDLGVVMGGDENSQVYYISKSDFWALTDANNNDGTPKAIGGLNITNASSGNIQYDYSATQNILDAAVVCDLPFNGQPIHTNAWISANTNELVVELIPVDSEADVTVTAQLWSKSNNNDNGYATSAGVEGNDVWVTRRTPQRARGAAYAAVSTRVIGGENVAVSTDNESTSDITFTIPQGGTVKLVTTVDGGKENTDCIDNVKSRITEIDNTAVEALREETAEWWKDFWLKEYVVLNDKILEEYYYGSLYQMGATSRAGKVAPGLFGHWTTTDSPAWGGDYTLDYNYYGPFNGLASSNRLEQFGSYFQPILDFMDEGRQRAKLVTSVNGKSYPDGMPGVKYPTHIGPWGMETYFDCGMKSNAAFATLPFIWYYNYTQDIDYLRDTAYPYLKAVADFWDEYLQKDESGRYVVYESSARESWSGSNDTNPVLDIAFVTTLYKNIIPMSEALGVDEDRREKWQDIRDNISPLPTMEYNGKTVFREAENRPEISTYGLGDNPVNMQGIFPADNVGLGSNAELRQIALDSLDVMNSWNQGNGFANIFVMGARVGWDAKDLMNKMKLRISAIKQPNLTYQSDGHGIEGSGVLEAINSMLMQSHEGVLRFFPVWPQGKDASFVRMRAVGAFLVNAELKSGVVQPVTIYSEKGSECTVQNPWTERTLTVTSDGVEVDTVTDGEFITFATEAGKEYTLSPAEGLPDPIPVEEENPYEAEAPEMMAVPDIGWWKLDDTDTVAIDSVGGKNGIIIGATSEEGKLSGAMHMDGSDDYIFIEDYEKPSAFATYSAWVRADGLPTWGTILKNWGEGTQGQMQLGLESDTGKLSVHMLQSNGNEVSCMEQTRFPTGEWQHVAVVADGSRIHLYHNGIETASTGYNGSLSTAFAPLGIGVKPNDKGTGAAASWASPGWWRGSIDDVRIYSKALSAEDIAVLASFERYNPVYSEDFEASSILTTIQGSRNGWSLGGSNEGRVVQRGDNLGLSSNAIRFGAGDTWGQTMWMSLDMQESMILNLLEDGVEYDTAQAIVDSKLSGNLQLSFSVYFDCGDEDSRGAEHVIKIKDSNYVPFATIKVTPNRNSTSTKLGIIALDGSKTQNKEYIISTGSDNVLRQAMNFKIDLNTADNAYKLNINGQDITTDNGVWIPASNSEYTGSASRHIFGKTAVKQIDYVINNSGWWHTMTVDNIKILKAESDRIVDTSINSVTATENGASVNAAFVNNSGDTVEFTAIYAAYNAGGKLVGAKSENMTLTASDASVCDTEIECSEDIATVKIFSWNSVTGMKPMSPYYPVNKAE